MQFKRFKFINNIIALVVLFAASLVYLLTIEPTTSFWDCGEFIASSYKLEVGHPPGNPMFQLIARFFTMFVSADNAAMAVNVMSAMCSAFTIFFLYLTIVHFARRINERRGKTLSKSSAIVVFASGVIGAMAYCFSDTFWFSAVEGEVYAMSSLVTAIVFWAMLKWEEQADEPYANRWIVLIALLMGLSIGIHLLNLLAIPPLVFIYYFKKSKNISLNNSLIALAISVVILAAILFVIMPYLPKVAAYIDLFFVNVLGAGYNLGAAIFMLLLFVLCFWLIHITAKKNKPMLNLASLCFTMILIGYSVFAVCIIRSSANTPTNEYQPDNPFTLVRYIGREQYGKNPLLYGQSYLSDRTLEVSEYYTPLNGKYAKVQTPPEPKWEGKMFFPRMWYAGNTSYAEFYDQYSRGRYTTSREMVDGEMKVVKKPRFIDNINFFLDFQVNWMYVRYFMWNFVGRQNDFHAPYENNLKGNWESGIKFIDEARLGDQSEAPGYLRNNKAKNHYYFLPLLLGLFGLFYQVNRDGRNSWITFLLFVLTGFAIVVYLNQPPLQVRERDYAYAGSFYAFAIWIGLGVMAINDFIERYLKPKGEKSKIVIATVAALLCLSVPVLMGTENWDDHDRSGRYTARDIAYNYLNTCDENAIIVTHGDNDTFPLWYIQEVEGVRTDVRVVNTSLLATDWYIDQMKCKVYESDPLPISIERKQYLYGTNDWVPVIESFEGKAILAKDAIELFKNKDVKFQGYDFIPSKNLIIPVNKENVKKYNIVAEEDYDKIEDYVLLQIPENEDYMSKTDLIMLDILANYEWDRPIYFLSLGGDINIGVDKWLQYSGYASKFVPIRSESNVLQATQINEDEMYDKLMNVYRFDNLKETDLFWDYQNIYSFVGVMPVRSIFLMVAEEFYKNGESDKVKELLDRCIEVMPNENFPYNISILGSTNEYVMLDIIDLYLKIGEKEKAIEILDVFIRETLEGINFFGTPSAITGDGYVSRMDYQHNLMYLTYAQSILEENGETEIAKAIEDFISNNGK